MPKFHLVVDEVVPVARHQFRVRVWRRADSRPLVLLSQVQGDVPPDWCSSALPTSWSEPSWATRP